jgi:hypothetical protein
MIKRSYMLTVGLGLFFGTGFNAQFPILDTIADKAIQKYQSSCELLILRNDPDRRAAFIN